MKFSQLIEYNIRNILNIHALKNQNWVDLWIISLKVL